MRVEQGFSIHEAILIEEGKVIRPFEKVAGFRPVKAQLEDTSQLLVVPVNFRGVDGSIMLVNNSYSGSGNKSFETPLGETRLVQTLKDGKVALNEMPLGFVLHFYVKDSSQVDDLDMYKALFNLGGEIYEMDLVMDGEKKEAEFGLNEEDREGVLTSDATYHNGEVVEVLLPMDLSRLSGIEATFVRKSSR